MNILVLLILTCCLFGSILKEPYYVDARRQYRERLPNAAYEIDGCSALGHQTCYPGNTRNRFGVDFQAAGFKYTRALCEKDSDGDGVSNGAELGDPCCLFVAGSGGTPPARSTDLSHPGRKDSVPVNPKNRRCIKPASADTPASTIQPANANNNNNSNITDFVAATPSISSAPPALQPSIAAAKPKVEAKASWVAIPGSKFNNPMSAPPTPLPPSVTASNTYYPPPTVSASAARVSASVSLAPTITLPPGPAIEASRAAQVAGSPSAAITEGPAVPSPSAAPTTEIQPASQTPPSALSIEQEAFPTASEATNKPACFPAHATVMLSTGEEVRMDALRVGDHVQVTKDSYSAVVMFTHALPHAVHTFVSLTVATSTSRKEDEKILDITPGHYLYVSNKLKPAAKVTVGDKLQTSDGSTGVVVKVDRNVRLGGLYNPQTDHGDIIVNGILTSTYTDAIDAHMAHAALAPFRALFATTGLFTRALEKGGL